MFNFLPTRVLNIVTTGPVKVISLDLIAYVLFILVKKSCTVKQNYI
jgi:hypothetical protein